MICGTIELSARKPSSRMSNFWNLQRNRRPRWSTWLFRPCSSWFRQTKCNHPACARTAPWRASLLTYQIARNATSLHFFSTVGIVSGYRRRYGNQSTPCFFSTLLYRIIAAYPRVTGSLSFPTTPLRSGTLLLIWLDFCRAFRAFNH